MHVELLGVGGEIGIPERDVDGTRLLGVGVQHEVVRAGFVAEALAVQVHLEPGLASHPEERAYAAIGSAKRVGRQAAAIEQHAGMRIVHLRTRPQAGLDAVAFATRLRGVEPIQAGGMRLQRLLHVDVDAVAAGGYQHALAGVDLDVSVLAFADGADHLVAFHNQLDHGRVVAERHMAGLLGVIGQHGESVKRAIFRPGGRMTGCPVLVVRLVLFFGGFMPELHAVLVEHGLVPVDGFARFFVPRLMKVEIALACGVVVHVEQVLLQIHRVSAFLLKARVHASDVVAHDAAVVLLQNERLDALFSGCACGEQAACASADDQEFGVDGFDDVAFLNGRLRAQPIGRCAARFSVRFFGALVLLRRASGQSQNGSGACQGCSCEEASTRYALCMFGAHRSLPCSRVVQAVLRAAAVRGCILGSPWANFITLSG